MWGLVSRFHCLALSLQAGSRAALVPELQPSAFLHQSQWVYFYVSLYQVALDTSRLTTLELG